MFLNYVKSPEWARKAPVEMYRDHAAIGFSKPRICGYWESTLELFEWACSVYGIDPQTAEWIDGTTGEVFDYDELEREYFDMLDEYESEVC